MKLMHKFSFLLLLLSSLFLFATEEEPEKVLTLKDVQNLIKESQRLSSEGSFQEAYRKAHEAANEALKIKREDFQVKALHQAVKTVLSYDAANKKDYDKAYQDLNLANAILDKIQINGLQIENKLLRTRLNRAYGNASAAASESTKEGGTTKNSDISELQQDIKNLAKQTGADLEKQNAYLQKQLSLQQQAIDQMTSEQLKTELRSLRQSALIDSMNMSMVVDSIRLAQKEVELSKASSELALEKSRRNQLIAISGIFVLIALIILIQYFNSRRFNRTLREKNELIEAEKARSDKLLLNILPADIAEELKEKGEVSARSFDEVTVLFTDFKDFTRTAENLSAVELVHELNICFKAFDEICGKYRIEKIKTIGDAFMAAGGLSESNNASPVDVVRAALEMKDFIKQRGSDRQKSGANHFEMRIGIHTGSVVAGIVGVKKFQYDIWGDTVNTAARMESVCEIGKVNVSQDTYEQIKDCTSFRFQDRGMIEAKGKGKIAMHFVDRA